jgi:hypothetical protein
MGNVIVIEGDRPEPTNILATVSEASAAGVGNLKAANRTLVTGYIDNLNDIGIILITAHGNLNALTKYSTFLVNTAAHCCFLAGSKLCGNIHHIFKQGVVPRKTCDFA